MHVHRSTLTKVYISHRIPYVSHLFEIQTASRTYLCGASTHEEMQSWVGILQTLTQYCGQHEIVGVCPGNGSDNEDGKELILLLHIAHMYILLLQRIRRQSEIIWQCKILTNILVYICVSTLLLSMHV